MFRALNDQIAALPSNAVVVLHVAGQSNAGERSDIPTVTGPNTARTFVWRNQSGPWQQEFNNTNQLQPSPVLYLAQQFDQLYPSRDLRIIWTFQGNTGFQNGAGAWSPTNFNNVSFIRGRAGQGFQNALQALINANTGPIYVAQIWIQGENDAGFSSSYRNYFYGANGIYGWVQECREVVPDLKVYPWKLWPQPLGTRNAIRAAFDAIQAGDPNRTFLWDIDRYPANPDNVHFPAISYEGMARNALIRIRDKGLTGPVTALGTRTGVA